MENIKLSDRAKQRLLVVDAQGSQKGEIVERWKAHTAPGTRHLAIGVLVFDKNNKLILHKRIKTKVGGNTIDYPVTHVLEGESPEQSCYRCLEHEYGIREKILLKTLFGFPYEYIYEDGTCENEYLLIFSAKYDGKIVPNKKEMVGKPILTTMKKLAADIEKHPEKYSVWFWDTVRNFKETDGGENPLK